MAVVFMFGYAGDGFRTGQLPVQGGRAVIEGTAGSIHPGHSARQQEQGNNMKGNLTVNGGNQSKDASSRP